MIILKVLAIRYVYTNKGVKMGSIPDKVKKYYEDNGRGHLSIEMTKRSMKVPFASNEFKKAIRYIKPKLPDGYDVYMHFSNPKRSQTSGKTVVTYASSVNAIHEFGHALGFSHANSLLGGKKKGSRDPFDQMTIFSPYPSTNAPHRFQKGWFLPGELLECGSGSYDIGMLKNFKDETSVKVLKCENYFISFGEKKGTQYVSIHTIYGPKHTFIIGMYKIVNGKTYFDESSNLTIKVTKTSNNLLSIDLDDGKDAQASDSEMEDCKLGHVESDDSDDCEDLIDEPPSKRVKLI
jgi:hypothetical protein